MALGFTCNSATNGNCTQISWLVNVLTKIQSSLHFSLHSRLRAFPVMCLPGFIPIWETEISRVRMFPENTFPTSYISLFVLVSPHGNVCLRFLKSWGRSDTPEEFTDKTGANRSHARIENLHNPIWSLIICRSIFLSAPFALLSASYNCLNSLRKEFRTFRIRHAGFTESTKILALLKGLQFRLEYAANAIFSNFCNLSLPSVRN